MVAKNAQMLFFFFVSVFASAFAAPTESNDLVLAAIRELGVRLGAFEARTEARFEAFEARSDKRFDVLESAIRGVEEALIIPAVAARLEGCAASTVLLFMIPGSEGAYQQCSAVPLPLELLGHASMATPPAASSYFLTSKHCFFNKTTKEQIAAYAILHKSGVNYRCVLRAHSPQSLDIALLFCAHPVPLPPTRLSTLDYAVQLPVAFMGFSEGRHVDPSLWSVVLSSPYSNKTVDFARHVRYTRLANSLQLPQDAGASAAAGAFGADGEWLHLSAQPGGEVGFIDDKPEQGMSGGAVVDTRCGVLGITELQSVHGRGGQFVRMTPFVRMWAAAAAAGFPVA